jgi:predicted acyltransferase
MIHEQKLQVLPKLRYECSIFKLEAAVYFCANLFPRFDRVDICASPDLNGYRLVRRKRSLFISFVKLFMNSLAVDIGTAFGARNALRGMGILQLVHLLYFLQAGCL